MKKIDFLHTLFVGIDVSSKTNVVCGIDFESNFLLKCSVPNTHPGALELADSICDCLNAQSGHFREVIIAMESTSFYGVHLATYLSSNPRLMEYRPYVYCLNPKSIANYRKSFIGLSKTDPLDAYIIADFARVGRIDTEPWRGSQYLALQRLTRHRLHLVECLTREKTYMLSNMFLKFSELAVSNNSDSQPFADRYGATACAVLTEFLSPEEILGKPLEELIEFIDAKGKRRFANPEKTAQLLRQTANNSYRLDQCLYEPITISIASSFNCITAYENEIKTIDKAIVKTIKGLNNTEYQCLISIPGIGPVYASGILAEIGSIKAFRSQDALAKYAGLVWIKSQSGNFSAEDTPLSKAGNSYLRYYLVEAANSVKNHVREYSDFYYKKFNEVPYHQHKRALALTSRKLIRLIFGLLDKNQLYSVDKDEN